jgi:ankyrin repeat protein
MVASKYGNIEIVRLFLSQTPKPLLNTISYYGENIIILACKKGHLDIVKLLYENGSPIDDEAKDGFTGFIYACSGGYLELVEYLFIHGANINHHNKEYDTGFTLACYNGHLEIVKFLIGLGININASGSQNYTGLMKACENFTYGIEFGAGYEEYQTMKRAAAISGLTPYEHSKEGNEARMAVIAANSEKFKHLDIIKLLIANKANVNHVGYNGNNALILSVLHKSDGFYELINIPGIDVDHEDADYNTALIYACRYKIDVEQIKLLLDKGADVNHIGSLYYTPLKYAILNQQIDLVRLLLDYGAGITTEIIQFTGRINIMIRTIKLFVTNFIYYLLCFYYQ